MSKTPITEEQAEKALAIFKDRMWRYGEIPAMVDALQSAADTPRATCDLCGGTGMRGPEATQCPCGTPPPQSREMGPTNLEEVAASIGFVLDNKRWEDCGEGFKEICRECAAAADRLIREDGR